MAAQLKPHSPGFNYPPSFAPMLLVLPLDGRPNIGAAALGLHLWSSNLNIQQSHSLQYYCRAVKIAMNKTDPKSLHVPLQQQVSARLGSIEQVVGVVIVELTGSSAPMQPTRPAGLAAFGARP